ncbi:LysR substrate-binding domain-containing protein [Rhizobium binxianense]
MNIRQLEAFHATMENGSVTRAGEKLRISQPAVSKLLKSFSDNCGFPLFVRSNGRLVPTLEARLLYAEVERMFSGTDRIGHVVRAMRNREWGQVTVAAPPAFSAHYLARALAPMLARQKDLHFTLKTSDSPRIAELVAAQQIDVGLSVLPIEHAHVNAEIIMRFEMTCVLPAGHPLAKRNVVRLEDLRGESFVGLPRDDCSLMTIDRAFQVRGIAKHISIEVPMSETACTFVANGAGVSILPPFVGLDYPEDRLVRRRLVPVTTMDVWLLTPSSRPLSLATQKMVEYIRAAVAPFDCRPVSGTPDDAEEEGAPLPSARPGIRPAQSFNGTAGLRPAASSS